MTWTTTHLGISSLLLYTFSPKKFKKELREDPKLFLILSLASIFPDLDIFTGLHRALLHSVFFPLLLIIFASHFASLKPESEKLQRNLQIFGFIWLTHMLYDSTFGPLALFWPVDTRFYDIEIGIKFGLEGIWLLPLTFRGFFIRVDHVNDEVGTDTFFINWTPQRRLSVFGSEDLDVGVSQFPVHATIFIWYLYWVVLPYIKMKRGGKANSSETSTNADNSLLRIMLIRTKHYLFIAFALIYDRVVSFGDWMIDQKNTFVKNGGKPLQTITLIVLMLSSFLAGPYQGTNWTETDQNSDTFWILSDGLRLNTIRTYEVSTGGDVTLDIFVDTSAVEFSVYAKIVTSQIADELNAKTSELFNLLNSGNLSLKETGEQYMLFIQTVIGIQNVNSIDPNTSSSWTFVSAEAVSIAYGIYSWNISDYFIKSIRTDVVWNIRRNVSYMFGLGLSFLFGVALATSLLRLEEKS